MPDGSRTSTSWRGSIRSVSPSSSGPASVGSGFFSRNSSPTRASAGRSTTSRRESSSSSSRGACPTAESYTINTACASGLTAVAQSFRAIKQDIVDIVLTGGMEAVLDTHDGYVFRAFDGPGALSRWKGDPAQASRPFDDDRKGFVMGEGGAGLIVESLDHAKARGARIYAEILGVSGSTDGDHMMRMKLDTVRWSILNAIKNAGKSPENAIYVNAHGTSTGLNDPCEAEIFAELFGERAIVRASKGNIGHLIGGAGPAALCETSMTLFEKKAAPNINLEKPLRDDIRLPTEVTDLPADISGKIAMVRCSGFGGHNWDICLTPFEE
ncbi:MAG: beta-ketoacyl-[acyl-carrier-protein] synthase family protein [Planctomycetota bacterium]